MEFGSGQEAITCLLLKTLQMESLSFRSGYDDGIISVFETGTLTMGLPCHVLLLRTSSGQRLSTYRADIERFTGRAVMGGGLLGNNT